MENSQKRLLYIDNLRVVLVILVVLSHIAITYGPVGFWYYYERTGLTSTYILAFFISLMQAFLVGLFFLISAYFIPEALIKKGPAGFLKDRFKRLGIPLLFYIFIIAPVILYLDNLVIRGERVNYFLFYYEQVLRKGVLDAGPLWFLQVLLLFSTCYVIFNSIRSGALKDSMQSMSGFPSNRMIFLAITALAITSFIIRLQFPISAVTRQLNLGLAPQYVFLFCLGIAAYKNRWFELITPKKARLWSYVAVAAVICWPIFIFIGGSSGFQMEMFAGGIRWQSFAYSFWEATLSISLSICIIYLFRKRFDFQSGLTWKLSKSSYTVFLIHALVIVLLSYALSKFELHPLVKFGLVSIIGIPLCFLVSFYTTRIPFLKRIL